MEMRINMKISCFFYAVVVVVVYHVAQTSFSYYTLYTAEYSFNPSYVIELDIKHHKSEEAENREREKDRRRWRVNVRLLSLLEKIRLNHT